jgi:hypothetical protein
MNLKLWDIWDWTKNDEILSCQLQQTDDSADGKKNPFPMRVANHTLPACKLIGRELQVN